MAVYAWGLGKNGELGTGKTQTEHTPQLITKDISGKKFGPVKHIDCGALFTVVLTHDGQLFSTGCGKHGRLGQGDKLEDCALFGLVKDLNSIEEVSCGSWHAAVVTVDGQLYVWGYQKACGGLDSQSNLSVPLSLPLPCKIKGVACGHNYSFAWSDEGQLFSWGKGHNGVLGHGSERDEPRPKRVEALEGQPVVSGGAGHSHCGIVTQDGQLFMIGKGSDGALGLGQQRLTDARIPTKVNIDERITAVSCSKGEHHGHTLALTSEGHVWAWGDGYKGKLGLGHHDTMYTPAAIDPNHFNKSAVVSICAGGIHSTAATADGGVYTWGCGSDGRLGHPEGQGHRYLFRSDLPKRVESLPKNLSGPALVSCAYYHTAAVVR